MPSVPYLTHARFMSLPSLTPIKSNVGRSPSCGFSIPRSVSLTAVERQTHQLLDWGSAKRVSGGSPYAINFSAECERIEEEWRVQQAAEARQHRREAKERERLRQEVVDRAADEESKVHQLYRQKMAILEEQKRLQALRDVHVAEAKHRKEKSDIHRRFYTPTPEVENRREEEWQRRRMQRNRELRERMKKVEVMNEQRRFDILRRKQQRMVRSSTWLFVLLNSIVILTLAFPHLTTAIFAMADPTSQHHSARANVCLYASAHLASRLKSLRAYAIFSFHFLAPSKLQRGSPLNPLGCAQEHVHQLSLGLAQTPTNSLASIQDSRTSTCRP